jgi:hypothetical protein
MLRNLQILVGLTFFVSVIAASTWAASDPAELDKYIRARIEIGETMTNYFKDKGGAPFGGKDRPSPEQMRSMQEDITARVGKVLSSHGLTVEEYRRRSPEVFADDAAVKRYLEEHPDLKKRYEALPLDRMGRGGNSRSYDSGSGKESSKGR